MKRTIQNLLRGRRAIAPRMLDRDILDSRMGRSRSGEKRPSFEVPPRAESALTVVTVSRSLRAVITVP